MKSFSIYPLEFYPIFKDRIWGGEKLKTLLNKEISSNLTGESWELSTVEGDISMIKNGAYQNILLQNLIELFPKEVLGTVVFERFGTQFPLLFKFLDAQQDLSIQVHPNDELAMKRHHTFGKTEMWYVMQADLDSKLIIGFKHQSTPEKYINSLKNNQILDLLETFHVKEGDAFMLETGTIHAIGAGTLIAEIQQTSDITYRIYDFDRKDSNGNKRELHTDLALEAINYNVIDSKRDYDKTINSTNNIVDCKYFTTNYIDLQGNIAFKKDKKSFTVLMCVEGSFEIKYFEETSKYEKGQTLLLPAFLNDFELIGNATILEIFIKSY